MHGRDFKDRLFTEFAEIAKALGNPHRLELLDLLAQGERSVEDLAREAHLGLTNASAHLQVLRRARLVEAEKRGLYVLYRLASPAAYQLWRMLRDFASTEVAAVDRLVETYLTDRHHLEAIDKEQLRQRLADESVTVIDVRPTVEYRQGHIPGARSIPVNELERRLAELPRDRTIVAYCRGPYCVFADEAVQLLQAHRYHAVRLEDGFPEWRSAGYPTTQAIALLEVS